MRLNMVIKEEEKKQVERTQDDSKRDEMRRDETLTSKPDRPVLPTAVCRSRKYIWLYQFNWTAVQ